MTLKKFDCVQMKRAIQEKLAKEFEGLSEDRLIALQKKKLEDNKTLNSFIEKVRVLKFENVQTH
jgi:hypothetical protein